MVSLQSAFVPTDRPDLYVIAEAGVNHDGSVPDAHALVDLAADSGADAVKFQTFDPAALVADDAPVAAYQAERTGAVTQRELLDLYVLPDSAWPELRDHARERDIDFLSTAFDLRSLDLICALGVPALKIGSGELTNKPLLVSAAQRGLPIIASTGMATLDEAAEAVSWLADAPGLLLMHCVSSYPTRIEDTNLRVLTSLRSRFGVPVGWSDHTVSAVSAVAAVALGAAMLEHHITLDTNRPGPDHAASAGPEESRSYVEQVRAVHAGLGNGVKAPTPDEVVMAGLVRRSWHVTRDLQAGAILGEGDVALLRPAAGIAPSVDVVGRVIARDVARGAPLAAEDMRA
jgi:N-acetylneuraminate synthase/N,N'-diacetyllegionaminate synthase